MLRALLLLVTALLGGPLVTSTPLSASVDTLEPVSPPSTEVIGTSVRGRPIRATRIGDGEATMLVVGCIHGNERAGRPVIKRLRSSSPQTGVTLWLIDLANPDGCAANTRGNAHGVDLNRNFPYRWESLPRG